MKVVALMAQGRLSFVDICVLSQKPFVVDNVMTVRAERSPNPLGWSTLHTHMKVPLFCVQTETPYRRKYSQNAKALMIRRHVFSFCLVLHQKEEHEKHNNGDDSVDPENISLFCLLQYNNSLPMHSVINSIVVAYEQYLTLDVEWLSDIPCRMLTLVIC